MNLRRKVFLYFGSFSFLALLVFFVLNYFLTHSYLLNRGLRDTRQIAESTHAAVENMLDIAIQNYLRSVVDQQISFLNPLFQKVSSGSMSEQEAKEVFQKHALTQSIGESGYIVALKQQDSRIILDIHPFLRSNDCANNQGCQDWIALKNGYSEYDWKNPEDKRIRKKVGYVRYFEPWGWVVGATSYKDEFVQLINIDDLEKFLSSFHILGQGYFTLMDDNLNMLVHPVLKGETSLKDADGDPIAKLLIDPLNTFNYYRWEEPNHEIKDKFAYSIKLDDLGWYLTATGYMEDITLPIDRLMIVINLLIVAAAIVLILLTFWFSRSLSQPLDELIRGLNSFYKDKSVFKMHSRSVEEIDAVGHAIEKMTQSLVDAEREKEGILDQLDKIINSMPSILICLDNNENITLWNEKATEYLGVSRDQALHKPLHEVISAEINIQDYIQQGIRSQSHYSNTFQATIDNRRNLEFAITVYPLPSSQKSAVILLEDITERVKTAETMVQSHKMEALGTLAGGIAHDFNNILTAVIGYSELANLELEDKDSARENINKVINAGNRAKNLVRQILTFSRYNKVELKVTDVSLVISEVLKLLRASLPTTIEMRERFSTDAGVMGDPTQVHQIVMNLCTNAAKAMPNGGVLEVVLSDEELDQDFVSRHAGLTVGRYLCLIISDNGVGMSPAVQRCLFDPFFTTRDKTEGTGMGLTVVHNIVKNYHGLITVYSEPDVGSTFTIFLPAVDVDRTGEEEAERTTSLYGEGHILFVDDEVTITEICTKMLENCGYQVSAFTDSEEAAAAFSADPVCFDLVISDMTMPKLPGDKLASHILEIRPDMPIIICSGYSERLTEDKAKDLGIKKFLMKPLGMNKLASSVKEVLEYRGGVEYPVDED